MESQIRRSTRARMAKKNSDIYIVDQKIELNEDEKDLIAVKEKRYCICRRTEEEAAGLTMIECDVCHDWFHDECLGLTSQELEQLEFYKCSLLESKPSKAHKKNQPSNADIELLIAALSEIEHEKNRKKKEIKPFSPKISLFHFSEPVNINRYIEVIGYMKNDSSSTIEEQKMIAPITKEDLEQGSITTSWGKYRIAATSDGKIQACSDLAHKQHTSPLNDKTAKNFKNVSVEAEENQLLLKINGEEPLELPVKDHKFQFKYELGKHMLELMKSSKNAFIRQCLNISS